MARLAGWCVVYADVLTARRDGCAPRPPSKTLFNYSIEMNREADQISGRVLLVSMYDNIINYIVDAQCRAAAIHLPPSPPSLHYTTPGRIMNHPTLHAPYPRTKSTVVDRLSPSTHTGTLISQINFGPIVSFGLTNCNCVLVLDVSHEK